MKVYRKEGRFKKKRERAKVKLKADPNLTEIKSKSPSYDPVNIKSSLGNGRQERNTSELLVCPLLESSFWGEKLTEHCRSRAVQQDA